MPRSTASRIPPVNRPGPPAGEPPPAAKRGRRIRPKGTPARIRSRFFPCPIEGCDRVLSSRHGRVVHLQWHSGEKPWLCTVEGCDRRFAIKKHRQEHLLTHTGEKPWPCPVEGCPARFICISNRNAHMQIHDVAKPWLCPVASCDKRFVTKGRMRMHLRQHGPTGRPPSRPEAGSGKGQARGLVSTAALSTSVLYRLRGLKPWACPFEGCNRSYSSKQALTAHQYEHSANKPFTCPVEGCPKWFPTHIRLDVHLRVHTGQRPYACPVEHCGKRFTKSNSLSGHMKTHKDDDSCLCPIPGCKRRFALPADRERHLATHPEPLPTGSPCRTASDDNRAPARTPPAPPASSQPGGGANTGSTQRQASAEALASCPDGNSPRPDSWPVDQPWWASTERTPTPVWPALSWPEDAHPGASVPPGLSFDDRGAQVPRPQAVPSGPAMLTRYEAACDNKPVTPWRSPLLPTQPLDPFGWLSFALPAPAMAPADPGEPCPAAPDRAPSPVQNLSPQPVKDADTDVQQLGDLYTFPAPARPAGKG